MKAHKFFFTSFAVSFLIIDYAASFDAITDIDQLPLDEFGHLQSNWLLFKDGDCAKKFNELWNEGDNNLRKLSVISGKAANTFWGEDSSECAAVCLDRGVPGSYIKYPIPEKIYLESDSEISARDWLDAFCQESEFGLISYLPNNCIVNWISPSGAKHKISDLLPGERNTFWTYTRLGHEFEVIDSVTGEVQGTFIAEYNSFFPLGDPGTGVQELTSDVDAEVMELFESEFRRSRRVRRSFTELGFNKGRLPDDLWGSIQTYYYNNRDHGVREEYDGHTINWYDVDPFFIGMPWGLKGYWQTRLRALVEKWIGGNITLENTDIYGMRRYEDGARLLSHVDREATHAVSLIVNVAQLNIREPWRVEIYDHADRLHEIEMNPGDIVYYESAKALHGRMKPLQGDFYVNFFTHYRPIGDPEWFLKPNPEGTPLPLINLDGECRITKDGAKECDAPTPLPTLSPTGHVVRSAQDLFDYWKSVAPKKTASHSEL